MHLPLSRDPIRLTSFLPPNYTPEVGLVSYGYLPLLRDRVFADLVGKNPFEPINLRKGLVETCREEGQFALRLALKHEAKLAMEWPDSTMPLTRFALGIAGSDSKLDALQVPRDFGEAIAELVLTRTDVLEFFAGAIKDTHSATRLFTFLRQLAPLVFASENSRVLDEIYRIVKSEVVSSSATVTAETGELLYVLTFLPSTFRYVVQNLLIANCQIDFLNSLNLQANKDRSIRDCLVKRLQIGVTVNDHWNALTDSFSMSDETKSARIEDACQFSIAARELYNTASIDDDNEVFRQFKLFQQTLVSKMRSLDRRFEADYLQFTDVGHVFSFGQYGNEELFCGDYIRHIRPATSKNGKFAVILEDQTSQLRRFAALVELSSPFGLPEGGHGLCQKPEQVRRFINDSRVELFLLDIANSTDATAGIKMAKEIIGAVAKDYIAGKSRSLLRVVVWSDSPKLVAVAKDQLNEQLNQVTRGGECLDRLLLNDSLCVTVCGKHEPPF